MTNEMTVSPSLLSTTAALPLPVGKTEKQSSSRSQWQIKQVGADAKGIHVMRLAVSASKNPFAKLVIELGCMSAVQMVGKAMIPVRIHPSRGVKLQVDETDLQKTMSAKITKMGTEVKLDLDRGMIEQFRNGKNLHLYANAAANGDPVHFVIPLMNFADVAHELNEISRQKTV